MIFHRFNMPMKELDEEMKDVVRAVQLRSYITPHKYFNPHTTAKLPKYFQVGTVVAGPTDFRDKRLTKRERKQNLAEELLADDEALGYTKEKYKEVQTEREAISKRKMILRKAIKKNRARRHKERAKK
eukprot:TRINITY_DN10824_c0_g1_i5.p2 TRINITY_DN10824_c0_g1~~TRINITY_DN10824_c0_g1_i5.p2  ORF type:complete len:128 (-),score=50.89 TRINITY_DN10824_c0_g1_i5:141-524(-)